MGRQTFRSDRLKMGLSVFWFIFTFSMVTWWWIFSLQQLQDPDFVLPAEKMHKLRRMLLWEGPILLAFIFGGGSSLLILTNLERLRNLRLRMFFSNFSHDLKTSLSRLRLRAEVLIENDPEPKLQKLMEEVYRLDLQLENSLWVARGEEQPLVNQEFSLGDLISKLRGEWPEIEVHLERNASLMADGQAIHSIFRNLFQNAWLHGKASKVQISVEQSKSNSKLLTLVFADNGSGFQGDLPALGKEMLPSHQGKGNGIGLYLTKFLLQKMNGKIHFQTSQKGFEALIELPGKVL